MSFSVMTYLIILATNKNPCGHSSSTDVDKDGMRFQPPGHRPYFFGSKLEDRPGTAAEPVGSPCWGYEPHCSRERSFSANVSRCSGTSSSLSSAAAAASSLDDQVRFFDEADFGYIRQRLRSLETICEKSGDHSSSSSSLVCSKNLQFCAGSGIVVDFRDLASRKGEMLRYSMDVLKPGQISGLNCKLNRDRLEANMEHMSPLQSWAPELRNFEAKRKTHTGDHSDLCDVVVEKPTFFMKIDASVNMYHHFCDFFNLYASMHLLSYHFRNSSSILPNGSNHAEAFSAFSRDVRILVWENVPYRSSFSEAFSAFSKHPVWNLNTFAGLRVCFSNAVVFPLLPRMVYGLYYNTPLSSERCQGSGLFKAFAQFLPHRLGIRTPEEALVEKLKNSSKDGGVGKKLRVTILKRTTKHRLIENLEELVEALEDTGEFLVTVAPFTHGSPSFRKQLEIIQTTTDILVGIHGAGLTHLLFLPDWAVVFELYHCHDPGCYRDLARLRGVRYITWTNDSLLQQVEVEAEGSDSGFQRGPASAKFVNYRFDRDEFVLKVRECADHVLGHPAYAKIAAGFKTDDSGDLSIPALDHSEL